MSDTDDIFLKRFSLIIGALILITIGILIIADMASQVPSEDLNPSRVALANDRIMPERGVRLELAEAAPVETVAMSAASEPLVIDGAGVYANACQACHMSGAAGAPKLGSDAWAERSTKGLDALVYSAVNGLNAMPARGGRPDLSDAEITAAVEYMLAQ